MNEKGDLIKEGIRPVRLIVAENIPEAWEKAMEFVWNNGISIKTQYDKPGDPPSKDAKVDIQVLKPFSQPRFHRAFADGLGGIAEYVQEVVHGAHDHWIRPIESIMQEVKTGKKVDTKWIYTYHQRLFEQPLQNGEKLDQIELMSQRLAKDLHSRRAQAITWTPWIDAYLNDPPCLQRAWARVFENSEGKLYLNMDTDWRSRDLFKAWFENTIALTTLQQRIADRVSKLSGKNVLVGAYTDSSNSLHIYGSYFHSIQGDESKGLKNFFANLYSRPFTSDSADNATSRTYTSEQVRDSFLDDGTGKGLESMLKREKDIPVVTRRLIEKDLQGLKTGKYLP
jgi:thymidylate synthase